MGVQLHLPVLLRSLRVLRCLPNLLLTVIVTLDGDSLLFTPGLIEYTKVRNFAQVKRLWASHWGSDTMYVNYYIH